jgi:hypothetical protein
MKLLLLFVLSFASYTTHAQYKTPPVELNNRLLTWADFKGQRPLDTFTAMTCSDLARDTAVTFTATKKPLFTAHAYFYPMESTVSQKYLAEKPDSMIQHLLNHEQKHYDLARAAAAQLNDLYRSFSFNPATATKQADSIRDRVARAIIRLQYIYDTDSRHSRNHTEQKRWDSIITEALKKRKLPVELIIPPYGRFKK